MELQAFLDTFPKAEVRPPKAGAVEKYRGLLPDSLLELWENVGWGKYGAGMIEIVDPEDYEATLELWLGKKKDNYVPVAISAFGELFYYRKLTETDEDVCMLDPHFRRVETCVWSLNGYFNDFLTDGEIIDDVLRKELFEAGKTKKEALAAGEIYFFSPALILGGAEAPEHLDKGNAAVHLHLLFEMGL